MYRFSHLNSFYVFNDDVYYGVEDGNIHQLGTLNSSYIFENDIYYGLHNGNLYKLSFYRWVIYI